MALGDTLHDLLESGWGLEPQFFSLFPLLLLHLSITNIPLLPVAPRQVTSQSALGLVKPSQNFSFSKKLTLKHLSDKGDLSHGPQAVKLPYYFSTPCSSFADFLSHFHGEGCLLYLFWDKIHHVGFLENGRSMISQSRPETGGESRRVGKNRWG